MIVEIVLTIQKTMEIEAVGIRLADELDYPYYFTRGFEAAFVEKEMHLCERNSEGKIIRDSSGNPVLECMCGNIISGRTDPSKPFYSPKGSFWSNCTTEFLSSTTNTDRKTRTRNRCNGEGYESVALIPIRSEKKIWGLIQLNDRRRNMFLLEHIEFYEIIGGIIGILFCAMAAKQQMKAKTYDVVRSATIRLKMFEDITEKLRDQSEVEKVTTSSMIAEKLDLIIKEINTLKGIIPICCMCKKVRTDINYWQQIEQFVKERSEAEFTHTLCPECYTKWESEELAT
jgi:hypothetical protein